MAAGELLGPQHRDVLPNRHVGEKGILLKEIAHLPPLGRKIDFGGAVKEGNAIQSDLALIRGQDPGNALEGHGFPAAGSAQQGQDLVFRVKPGFQMKRAQCFSDIHMEHQARTSFPFRFCRLSNRLTVSKKTAEMAMFTSTQRRAPASSLVRQSW